MSYHKIINNNQQSYIVIPKEIRESLGLTIGSWAKITVRGNSMIVTKTSEPPKKEVNLEAQEFNQNKNKSNQNQNQNQSKTQNKSKSRNVIVTEDDISAKIIQILENTQIIELSDLLKELNVPDKGLIITTLKKLIENNTIKAKEEGDNIFFLLP